MGLNGIMKRVFECAMSQVVRTKNKSLLNQSLTGLRMSSCQHSMVNKKGEENIMALLHYWGVFDGVASVLL